MLHICTYMKNWPRFSRPLRSLACFFTVILIKMCNWSCSSVKHFSSMIFNIFLYTSLIHISNISLVFIFTFDKLFFYTANTRKSKTHITYTHIWDSVFHCSFNHKRRFDFYVVRRAIVKREKERKSVDIQSSGRNPKFHGSPQLGGEAQRARGRF